VPLFPEAPAVKPFRCTSPEAPEGVPLLVCLTPEDAIKIGKWGQEIAEFYAALKSCPALEFRGENAFEEDLRRNRTGVKLINRIAGY
jgi:hypothetical protein